MYLLEVGGLKRTKVAAAAVKSSLCFDIICLSRTASAWTRQQLTQLGAAFVWLYADMITDTHFKGQWEGTRGIRGTIQPLYVAFVDGSVVRHS